MSVLGNILGNWLRYDKFHGPLFHKLIINISIFANSQHELIAKNIIDNMALNGIVRWSLTEGYIVAHFTYDPDNIESTDGNIYVDIRLDGLVLIIVVKRIGIDIHVNNLCIRKFITKDGIWFQWQNDTYSEIDTCMEWDNKWMKFDILSILPTKTLIHVLYYDIVFLNKKEEKK